MTRWHLEVQIFNPEYCRVVLDHLSLEVCFRLYSECEFGALLLNFAGRLDGSIFTTTALAEE